jgi:hypothetical protein
MTTISASTRPEIVRHCRSAVQAGAFFAKGEGEAEPIAERKAGACGNLAQSACDSREAGVRVHDNHRQRRRHRVDRLERHPRMDEMTDHSARFTALTHAPSIEPCGAPKKPSLSLR